VKSQRTAAAPDNALVKLERAASEAISASLEYYRAMRDAASEASFFETYGNVFSLYIADRRGAEARTPEPVAEARDLPFVQEALASMSEGGYPEALARVASLLARKGQPMMLTWLHKKHEMMADYRDLLPAMPMEAWRRVRGEQEIIVRFEPEKALATLPDLVRRREDRDKLATLFRRLLADERFRSIQPTTEELALVERIGASIGGPALPRGAKAAARRSPRGAPRKRTARAKA
jgi:hypothetical protein